MKQFSRIRHLGLIAFIFFIQVGLNNGQAIQNCELIKNGVCLSCLKGFALNSTRKACITSPVVECVYLNAYNKCLECSCGMVVNEAGTQCISVNIEGCRQVNSSKQCINAKPFYMITPQGVKYNMNNNCKRKSNIWNTADCAQCHEGYYLLNGRCQEITNISDYTNSYAILFKLDSNNQIDFTCLPGWYDVKSDTVKGCFLNITNCKTYDQSGVLSVCISCETGYISSNSGQICTKVVNQIENCDEIDNPSSYKCVRCNQDSLYLSGVNTCTTRDTIPNCILHNPTQKKCQKCETTYYLSAPDTCTLRTNNNNCLSVDPSADKCLSCSDNQLQYLDTTTKSCITRVNNTDPQCMSYETNKDSCSKCNDNYYLKSGICTVRTTKNCIQGVVDQDKCSLCEADYILQSNGTCKQDSISKKCLSIDSSGTCNQCVTGYGIAQSGVTCLDNFQNIPMCKVYTKGNSTICQECDMGFLLTNDKLQCLVSYGSCLQKASNCNKNFISKVGFFETYTCNPLQLIADLPASSKIKQFSYYLFTVIFVFYLFV